MSDNACEKEQSTRYTRMQNLKNARLAVIAAGRYRKILDDLPNS